MSGASAPSDHADRQLAIRARSANLLVDAGAGTGKTRLVVDRLLEMIAPADDGVAVTLDRIAAITFTRRAAGELRLRLRESLLSRLADTSLSEPRRGRLLAAVSLIDTAFIGTIHGFADRLLRLCPVETDLSPSYDIVQDEEDLVHEAFLEMLHAAQAGTLRARFASSELANRAGEVEETLVQAIEAGLRANTEELDAYARVGLDWLVRDMLRTRDHRAVDPATPHFDDVGFRRAVNEYLILVRPLSGATNGERWMLGLARRLRDLGDSTASKDLFDLVRSIDQATRKDALKATKDFVKGPGRDAWTTFSDQLANDLRRPIERWMAGRLLRIAPIAEAIYDSVKRRRRNVDTVDLLLKLAQLLRTDLAARKRYQSLFDHIFVDEFQDTDPLQAEIILFLAEKEPTAKVWSDTVLGKGRLTLVGDPKQSIYRFRRADVTMYQAIYTHIARQPGALSITLRDNFRSSAGLVNWFNDRFARVLGTSGDGRIVDPSTGGVFHRPLTAYRRGEATKPSSIHVLPLAREAEDSRNAPELRALEGEAIAGYVRWLVETSDIRIADSSTGAPRKIRYSDVAVLALVTTQLQPLFRACDELSVPYAAAGGTLFLRDPLHRQFLLALRALSDADDGVAEAALMRPPFFAVDLWDVLQARAPEDAQPDQHAAERGRAARDLVRTLRRERFTQSPGTIARRLIDETALGRVTALGPNGEQRVKHLRELCTTLDQRAAESSLDFDGMTALARSWIDWPIQFDAPRPLWSDAVQVLTVHQAKGLEFPVVVLWDSCGAWSAADRRPVFVVDRSQRKWALRVEGLSWEEPEGGLLLDRAQSEADAERRRVVYVAATRARDLLVVPHAPGSKFDDPKKAIHAMLVADSPKHVHFAEPYSRTQPPGWYTRSSPRAAPRVDVSAEMVRDAWEVASKNAKAPCFVPGGVSAYAKLETRVQLEDADDLAAPPPRERRRGRFGPLFGDTVHVALRLALTKRLAPAEAVERAARASGLAENHHAEAAADVGRALETLEREGLSTAATLRLEYPVGEVVGGHLLIGYVDFVALTATHTTVIDFKTDSAPTGRANASHPRYVAQVQVYVAILRTTLAGAEGLRGGLLWTETGRLEWV